MLPLRFFGVCDGYGGKVVAKFCAKYLQRQVLKNEAYTAGDLGTSVQTFFFGMDKLNAGKAKMRKEAWKGFQGCRLWEVERGPAW